MPQNNTAINRVKLVECPRDAMQGWKNFIPTQKKIEYINALLQVGFDTIDFGSFVSAKAIPQMADTGEVIRGITATNDTKLLAIVANVRGAEEALAYDKISCLGFPFSVSPTFQLRNTNSSPEQSLIRVAEIQERCIKNNRELVVYISMAFGNPYGDIYDEETVIKWVDKIAAMDINVISLADTVGLAEPRQISSLLNQLVLQYPGKEIGVHLHSAPYNRQLKIDAAVRAGCKRFDSALKGIGGCPMAGDELVGNINTEVIASYFEGLGILPELDEEALQKALYLAGEIFI